MSSGKLAILMPVYNNQAGLLQSLDSLRGQVDWGGVFVVDDGSNPRMCVPEDCPVRLVRLDNNQGIVGALNQGLELIQQQGYDYVARLDAGDVCAADRLPKQVEYLNKNPSVAVVGSYVQFVDMSGQPFFDYCPPVDDQHIRRAMRFNSAFCHPAVMMRVSALQHVGGYRQEYQYAEDYDLFFRLLKHYKGHNIPECLLVYEVNSGGISLSKRKLLLDRRYAVQKYHFDAKSVWAWLGILQTVVLRLVPNQWLLQIKKMKGKA